MNISSLPIQNTIKNNNYSCCIYSIFFSVSVACLTIINKYALQVSLDILNIMTFLIIKSKANRIIFVYILLCVNLKRVVFFSEIHMRFIWVRIYTIIQNNQKEKRKAICTSVWNGILDFWYLFNKYITYIRSLIHKCVFVCVFNYNFECGF